MFSILDTIYFISITYEPYSVVSPATNSPSKAARRPLYSLSLPLLARTPRPDRLTKLQHRVCMVSHADRPKPGTGLVSSHKGIQWPRLLSTL